MAFCILTTKNHPHDDGVPPLYLTIEDNAILDALKQVCREKDSPWSLEVPHGQIVVTISTFSSLDALSKRWNMGLSRRVAEQLGIAEQTQKQAAIKAKVLASGLLDADELAHLGAIDWSTTPAS